VVQRQKSFRRRAKEVKREYLPKIRAEVLEDAVTLGGMGFSAHFGQCNGGWFPANRLCG
jgi:hypothetical protein